jgi:branched-chain amino acid transport system permease protein
MRTVETPVGTIGARHAGMIGGVLVAIAVPLLLGDFLLFLAASGLALGLYGASFDLLYGYTGLLSFGHSVFFGAGAYAATFALDDFGQGVFVGLVAAFLLTALVAVGIGIIAVRVKSHGFVIVTILIALIAQLLAETFTDITGGTDGRIVSVPPVDLPGLGEFSYFDPLFVYYFTLAVLVVSLLVMYQLVNSRMGLVFRMIRENEQRARMLGYNVTVYKLVAFIGSGAFAGIAGVLTVYINGFVDASQFSLIVAGDAIIFTMLGGRATLVGAVIGAVLIEGSSNYVSQLTDAYPLIIGLLLLVTVVAEPDGLIGLWNRLRNRLTGPDEAQAAGSEVSSQEVAADE